MQNSNDTSSQAGTAAPTGATTASAATPNASRPTPTEHFEFSLVGTKDRPDPATHAWREDLADVTLAGRVIASHYAAPVKRVLNADAVVRHQPDNDADEVTRLKIGAPFDLLDSRGDWAWGYAGEQRLVGYVPVASLG